MNKQGEQTAMMGPVRKGRQHATAYDDELSRESMVHQGGESADQLEVPVTVVVLEASFFFSQNYRSACTKAWIWNPMPVSSQCVPLARLENGDHK